MLKFEIETYRDIPFGELERLQAERIRAVQEEPETAYLIVSEPRPTYTGGISASETGLLWNEGLRRERGIALHKVSRGGQWTYHGPGQIVIYPILKLAEAGYGTRGVRAFLHDFREALRATLGECGIAVETGEPFGLYRAGSKLASFGIGVRRGVTAHGVAVYFQDQRGPFAGIHPCGVISQPITSLAELGLRLSWEETAERLAGGIKKGFLQTQKCLIFNGNSSFSSTSTFTGDIQS